MPKNPVHDFVHEFMTNSCYCVVFYNIANFALLLIEWCFGIVWYCVKSYVLEPLSPLKADFTSKSAFFICIFQLHNSLKIGSPAKVGGMI